MKKFVLAICLLGFIAPAFASEPELEEKIGVVRDVNDGQSLCAREGEESFEAYLTEDNGIETCLTLEEDANVETFTDFFDQRVLVRGMVCCGDTKMHVLEIRLSE